MATSFEDSLQSPPPLAMTTRAQLSLMMFLQFAVWGSWFTVFFPYLTNLKFEGFQAGVLIGNVALGAILSNLFAGFIADRLMDARLLMAICHLAGGVLLYYIAQIQSPEGYDNLYYLTLLYAILYNPTLVLTNAITFRHVPSAGRDFPGIRVFGTIGWIAAGLAVGKLLPLVGITPPGVAPHMSNAPLLLAAALSVLLGVYSLTLPATPPMPTGKAEIPMAKAFGLFKNPSFAVFFTVSFAITLVLSFYYTVTSDFLVGRVKVEDAASTMTIGQICELIFLPLLPWFLLRLGMKWVLALGMLCWGVRYLAFSQAGPDGFPFMLAIFGIALHGICFDFFFAAGFIYCDNEAPPDIRASAQALFSFLTYGVGMWLGALAAGWLRDYYTTSDGTTSITDWQSFWLVPAVGVLTCFVVFVLFFRMNPKPKVSPDVNESLIEDSRA